MASQTCCEGALNRSAQQQSCLFFENKGDLLAPRCLHRKGEAMGLQARNMAKLVIAVFSREKYIGRQSC